MLQLQRLQQTGATASLTPSTGAATATTPANTETDGATASLTPSTGAATATTPANTETDAGLLTLSTGAVVGVVIAMLVVVAAVAYTCGVLTGLLIRRRRKKHASGDLSTHMYEQVIPTTQTSVPLKEKEACGQFNS